MSLFLHIFAYLAIAAFAGAVAFRVKKYLDLPLHVRWELYPVAHEGKKAEYGGSYMEEVDWWKKPRHKNKLAELATMGEEILLLKGVWEKNRSLWYVSYPFHLGLYLAAAFVGLLVVGAIAGKSFLAAPVHALTSFIGPLSFVLILFGSVGLFRRRMTDEGLKPYNAASHFINLALFAVTMIVAILTWLLVDTDFSKARSLVADLAFFRFDTLSGLFALQVFCGFFLLAYIPMTHMAHFFMKYFMWHDIRWGDEPNIDTPETDAKIGVVLNYPVTWGASHIAGHGRTTWAEVATFNPALDAKDDQQPK